MGRHAPSDHPTPSVTAANGVLRFSYCEGGPGRRKADTEHQHCLVVPAQFAPIRAASIRDGVTHHYTLNKGDIALAPQGSDVTWEWFDPAKVILIWLNPEALQRFIELDMRLLLTGNTLENEVVINDPALAKAAHHLHGASLRQDVGADVLFDALARVFLVNMVRNYGIHDPGPAGTFDLKTYSAVIDHIEARLEHKITPASLAAIAGMSEATFARKFKTRTGQSPMAFVKQVRLRAARIHLQDGRLSLGEIAVRCGFSDQAHFSRAFRASYGATPGKYRSNLRP